MIKRRITWGRTFSLCAVVSIFLFDTGCVGGVLGVEKVPVGQTWLVPSPGAGVLDWQNAEFALPIDQYAMSQHDIQLVNAAHTVLLIRCVNGVHPLDVVQVGNIKQWLSAVNLSQHWMFGNWDAPYVAQYGGVMGPHPTPISIEDLSLDMGQVAYCVNDDPSVLNMTPRSPMFGCSIFRPPKSSATTTSLASQPGFRFGVSRSRAGGGRPGVAAGVARAGTMLEDALLSTTPNLISAWVISSGPRAAGFALLASRWTAG